MGRVEEARVLIKIDETRSTVEKALKRLRKRVRSDDADPQVAEVIRSGEDLEAALADAYHMQFPDGVDPVQYLQGLYSQTPQWLARAEAATPPKKGFFS